MLKAAVIGVGAMGQHHARIYDQMADTQLVGVADANVETGERIARLHHTVAYTDHRRLLDQANPEVVTVAVPTRLHYQVVIDALEAGCHVLVEKPIAAIAEEGQAMIARAAELGRVLTVGHIERFNPAVIELKRRLDAGEIGRVFHLNVRRWSPYPPRIQDVGVVLDLATHDLDIMCYLLGDKVERVYAEVDLLLSSSGEDSLSAFLRFRNGALGALDVNWVTPCKVRQLSVTGERGMITVDYLLQELLIYQNSTVPSDWEHLASLKGVSEGDMIRPAIARREPLRVELESFVRAVVDGSSPLVTGEEALGVLQLATALMESARTMQPIVMS